MLNRIDPDSSYDPPRSKKQSALVLNPVHGVLPYEGARNPLTRSNTAYRISAPLATPATKGIPKIYHFEGESEWAVALEALLDPDLYALDVQLPPMTFRRQIGTGTKLSKHYFDLRVTLKDGFRLAIYVKNGRSLSRSKTQEEIAAIEEALPEDLADAMIVVNADEYTRPYKSNLFRFSIVMQDIDREADEQVEWAALNCSYWSVSDLIAQCKLPSNRAFPAVQRLVARKIIRADWYSVVSHYSRIWVS